MSIPQSIRRLPTIRDRDKPNLHTKGCPDFQPSFPLKKLTTTEKLFEIVILKLFWLMIGALPTALNKMITKKRSRSIRNIQVKLVMGASHLG